ncbi:hypothetical protein ABK040_005360 [Willaertia magna]
MVCFNQRNNNLESSPNHQSHTQHCQLTINSVQLLYKLLRIPPDSVNDKRKKDFLLHLRNSYWKHVIETLDNEEIRKMNERDDHLFDADCNKIIKIVEEEIETLEREEYLLGRDKYYTTIPPPAANNFDELSSLNNSAIGNNERVESLDNKRVIMIPSSMPNQSSEDSEVEDDDILDSPTTSTLGSILSNNNSVFNCNTPTLSSNYYQEQIERKREEVLDQIERANLIPDGNLHFTQHFQFQISKPKLVKNNIKMTLLKEVSLIVVTEKHFPKSKTIRKRTRKLKTISSKHKLQLNLDLLTSKLMNNNRGSNIGNTNSVNNASTSQTSASIKSNNQSPTISCYNVPK